MSTTELIDMIKQLPADKQKEVENLISLLVSETSLQVLSNHTVPDTKKRMQFGDLKGFVTYISNDFDEPLDDFKDYM